MNEKVIRQLIYFHKLTQLHYPLIKVNNFAHGSIWALPILCKNQDTQFLHSVGSGYIPESWILHGLVWLLIYLTGTSFFP